MPRRPRLSLTLVFFLSLLLSIASIVLWGLSNTGDFWVQASPGGVVWAFKIRGGEGTLYRITRLTPYPNRSATLVQFPLHYILSISAFAAFVSGVYAFGPRRKKPGCCAACGYNVSGVCPECGARVNPSSLAI